MPGRRTGFLARAVVAACAALGAVAAADAVILKNGNTVTGKVVDENADRVILERPSGGVLTIPRKDIQQIARDGKAPAAPTPNDPAAPPPKPPQNPGESIRPLARVDGEGFALVLVPVGKFDTRLLLEVARNLAPDLGIPVLVQDAGLELPPASRDLYKIAIDRLRKGLRENIKKNAVENAMEHHRVSPEDLENDVPVIKVHAEMLLRDQGRAVSEKFKQEIGRLSGEGGQWDVDDLLAPLAEAAKPFARPGVGYMAVTAGDLCDDGVNFVCGGARKESRMGAVSCHRFLLDREGKPADRSLLYQRLRKQCLVTTGLMFGIPWCDDARCAQTYAETVEALDSKGSAPCKFCRAWFAKTFGAK